MTNAPVDDLDTTLRAVGDIVAGIRDDQWQAATPCSLWSVRDVTNHLALGNKLFAGLLAGKPGYPLDPDYADALGDDPAGSYRRHATDIVTAFRRPGALEQVIEAPVGAIPGIAAVQLRTVEDLVHGWDLATATSQRVDYPDDIVERALAFTRDQLASMEASEDGPFAPPQPHPDDAPPIDRLVALLGRRPLG
ncbi:MULTISPECIES: TIGR03086 family metal-binding protein [Prauserella salsuginis group]|uniref:TIGR03086 family metal-binding protein n=1 Tax=Prauserella salsuginis TaxID=387889 RepID=A0ABW6FX73_9PSEU|nr:MULTISPECIES: TIGR03086 family metal-binding protein [Prauserella salsuginis group]MCR3720372.1 TIGR03086 family protein [Prauserella flava]MCR3733919.1 TIGR03086 family protein [Prauserella salsuginis]